MTDDGGPTEQRGERRPAKYQSRRRRVPPDAAAHRRCPYPMHVDRNASWPSPEQRVSSSTHLALLAE